MAARTDSSTSGFTADLAALAAIHTSERHEGSLEWVVSEAALFVLRKSENGPIPVPDGAHVIQPQLPGDVWEKLVTVAGGPVFVYRPGEPSPSGNVFSDWNALYAAVSAAQGLRSIEIDDTIVTPAVVPAGTYDLLDVTLRGRFARDKTALDLDDGVVFTNFHHVAEPLTITSHSTASIVTVVDSAPIVIERGAVLTSDAGAYLVDVPAGVTPVVVLLQGARLESGALNVSDAASQVSIAAIEFAGVLSDSLTGPGLVSVQVVSASAQVSTSQTGLGSLIVSLAEQSAQVSYSPAASANWSGDPTQVASALDRIAASVAGLLGGPIP